MHRSPSIQHKS